MPATIDVLKRLGCGLALALLAANPARTAPTCAVDVQPKASIAPLNYLVTRVTIEPNEHLTVARLVLVNEGGHLRSSLLDTDTRTQWIRWQLERLPADEYVVALDVWDDQTHIVCHAEGRVIVN